MSKIDLVLATVQDANVERNKESRFSVELHSANPTAQADKLLAAMPEVATRLQQIIDKTSFPNTASSSVSLEEVEFHLGIEGGLSIGLSAKAEAAITLKFKIGNSRDK